MAVINRVETVLSYDEIEFHGELSEISPGLIDLLQGGRADEFVLGADSNENDPLAAIFE